MLTMSALQRALSCDGSLVLPRARTHNVWADQGHDEHEDLSDFAGLPPEIKKYIPESMRAEVKLAYDVLAGTGRIIGEGSDRGYGEVGPFEIPGSCDGLAVCEDDAGPYVLIVDWKGWQEVAPARSNAQLWGYALAACRALGIDRAIVRILYARERRLLRSVDEYEIDFRELADFASRLSRLYAKQAELKRQHSNGVQVTTNEGSHCKHCESKHACASKNALLIQLSGKGLAVVGDTVMTNEKAADAVRQFLAAEQLVKDAKARLTAFVDENGPIDLGNGEFYGRYQKQGDERLDGAVARRAIAEVVGEQAKEFLAVAIENRTSKAALERAAKAIGKPPKFAKMVVQKIRDMGGASHASPERPIGKFTDRQLAAPPPNELAEIDRLLRSAG